MVNIARLPSFLTLAALATIFLNFSAEAAMDCGEASKSTNTTSLLTDESKAEYIVTLKSEGDGTHSKWLDECLGVKTQSIFADNYSPKAKNMATSFSVKGTKLQGYSGTFSTKQINQITKRDDVKSVEKNGKMNINYAVPSPNNLFKRTTDNNPTFNLDRIDQAKLPLDGTFTIPDSAGKGVNIFVIDTGVDSKHSEFGGRAKLAKSFCDTCKKEDDNGHGSHVSSIAAGKTVGVARSANIMGVQVLDANGSGSNTNVINGMSFVLDQHKNGKNKNTVVSMSLGGAFSQAVNDGVKELTAAGVHVVVAAGNDGEDACKSSPASEPSAITVGATEKANDNVTDFSNIGKCVDIFGPGRDIKGAKANFEKDFVLFSGTSQATPHVSGTVALVIAESGNSSPADMAKTILGLSSKGVIKKGLKGSPDNLVNVPK